MKQPSRFPRISLTRFLALSLGLAIAGMSPAVIAANVYWDTNGATPGASAGTTANGTWNMSSTANWSTDSTGSSATTDYTTASGTPATADVFFSAGTNATGTSTITLDAANATTGIVANSITIEEGAITTSTTNTGSLVGPLLTLGSGGVTLSSTAAGASSFNSNTSVGLSASQSWTNNNGTAANTFSSAGTIVSTAASGTTTLTLAGVNTGANTLSGVIGNGTSGATVALLKDGAGSWTLSAANTYTGGTTINAGTLRVGNVTNNGNLGASSSTVTLNGGTLFSTSNTAASGTWGTRVLNVGASGGTLSSNGSATTAQNNRMIFNTVNTLTGSGALSIQGNGGLDGFGGADGAVIVNTSQSYSGAITLSNGGLLAVETGGALGVGATVTMNNQTELALGAVTFPRNVTVNGGTATNLSWANAGGGNLSGTVTLNANLTIANRNWFNATANSGQISGVISGVGFGLTVNGGTGTVTLSGANTYTGGTTITQGNVNISNNTAFGTGAVSIATGQTVTATAALTNLANTFTGAGAFTTGTGQAAISGDWTAFTGTVTAVAAADLNFLSNYSGGFYLGTSASAAYVNNFTGANTNGFIFNNSSGAQTVRLGSYASVVGSNLRNSGASTGTTTLEIGNKNTSTVAAGTIGGGGGTIALTKVGSGALTLSGANTYTGGTTISAGTLLANTAVSGTNSATGTGAVSVSATGILGGTGQIAPTGTNGISVSGNIAPGASIGTLTVNLSATTGGVTMADGSTFTFELGTAAGSIAAAAGSSTSDRLAISGSSTGDFAFSALGNTVNLSGGSNGFYKLFDTDLADATNAGDVWTNLTYDETSGLVSAGLLSAGNNFFVGTAGNGGDLGDIYLEVVPEPSTFVMLLGGLGMLVGFQRVRGRR